jgi:hypothetical protein
MTSQALTVVGLSRKLWLGQSGMPTIVVKPWQFPAVNLLRAPATGMRVLLQPSFEQQPAPGLQFEEAVNPSSFMRLGIQMVRSDCAPLTGPDLVE